MSIIVIYCARSSLMKNGGLPDYGELQSITFLSPALFVILERTLHGMFLYPIQY